MRTWWIYVFIFLMASAGCQKEQENRVEFNDSLQPLTVSESIHYLKNELKRTPDNSNTLVRIATSFSDYNLDSAIHYAGKALEYSDSPGPVHFLLARLYVKDQKPQEAIQHGLSAEEAGLVSSNLKKLIARQYMNMEDWGKADLYLQQALELSDEDESTIILRARLYLFKGDTASAISSLNTIEDDTYAFDKNYLLGGIYDARGRDSLALRFFHNAEVLEPANESLLRAMAQVYIDLDQPDSALSVLRRVPATYNDLMQLARIHYQQLSWDSALFYGAKAQQLDSTAVDPLMLEARIYSGRRDFESARYIYDSLINADTTNIEAVEALSAMENRIRYLIREQQEKRRRDSLLFRPLPIRRM